MAKAMTTSETGRFVAKRALSNETAYAFSTLVQRKEWGVQVKESAGPKAKADGGKKKK
jgi:hypothetical protein